MRRVMFGLLLLTFGCEEAVESTDVRTSGIYPEITVTADGSGSSEVKVRLKVGGNNSNTFLDLQGGDKLKATVDGTTRTLEETSAQTYTASFATDAEDTEFTIAFLRSDDDDSAPKSKVKLPAPFDLSVSPAEASRADDDLELSWDPPADGNVNWSTDGDCVKSQDDDVPDDGDHVLGAGSIKTFDSDKDETCTVRLELKRARSGSLDPAFSEGGEVTAYQVRVDSFTSTP